MEQLWNSLQNWSSATHASGGCRKAVPGRGPERERSPEEPGPEGNARTPSWGAPLIDEKDSISRSRGHLSASLTMLGRRSFGEKDDIGQLRGHLSALEPMGPSASGTIS